MPSPAGKLATYEDLLALEGDVRVEVLGGQIVTAPAPLWDDAATARIAPFVEIEIEVGRLFLPRNADDLTGG